MRIPTAHLMLCLLAVSAAGCAGSQGPALSAADKGFLGGVASYDQNHDNVVTCDEWKAAAGKLFARADKAGAGYLTQAEFPTLAKIDRTFSYTDFKYFDRNGDGKIDRAEFVEHPNPAFTYADKDKDCRLNELELLTARNQSSPPKPKKPKQTGPVTQSPSTSSGY